MNSRQHLFAGTDRAIFATSFVAQLRDSGVPVAFTSAGRFVSALEAVAAPDLRDLYWMARISLVADHRQIERFDAVFDAIFDAEMGRLPGEQRGQQQAIQPNSDDTLVSMRRQTSDESESNDALPWATLPSADLDAGPEGDDDDDDDAVGIPELRPSAVESEADRPFDLLDEAALARVGEMLEASTFAWPTRRSRRRRAAASGGHIAMRRTMQRALRTGGDVVDLVHTRQRVVPRRVVAILDVSGSMETFARAYLHFARPLAVRRDAEVFAFATSLTRITHSIRRRSAVEAIDHLGDAVGDRFGGTRLGASLAALLRHQTWSTLVRGAVVVIFSDGWDTDDPEEARRQMRRLSLRAHRVVWVNPRAAADGFEPLVGGMAAALPYCDEFLSGHTARSLDKVIEALAHDARSRRVAS